MRRWTNFGSILWRRWRGRNRAYQRHATQHELFDDDRSVPAANQDRDAPLRLRKHILAIRPESHPPLPTSSGVSVATGTVAAAVGRAARARRPPCRSARRSICYGASRKTDAASGTHKDKTSGFLPFHGAGSAVGSIAGSVVARKGVVSPSMPGASETLSALEQRLARVQARAHAREGSPTDRTCAGPGRSRSQPGSTGPAP